MKPSTAAQQQRIDFYKAAFSATEQVCLADPRGKVTQSEIRIGNAPLIPTIKLTGFDTAGRQRATAFETGLLARAGLSDPRVS
jgi:hypothetical protein